jgi:hypothetical protein
MRHPGQHVARKEFFGTIRLTKRIKPRKKKKKGKEEEEKKRKQLISD